MKTCRYCGVEIELEGVWSSVASPSTFCTMNTFSYHRPYARVDPLTVSAVVEQLRRIARETAQ